MHGSGPIPDDPMLNYWLRMAAGAFTMIGVLFLMCAWKPHKFANIIPLLAVLNTAEGILLLCYGLMLKLAPFPFVVVLAIGLVPGFGVLLLKDALNKK